MFRALCIAMTLILPAQAQGRVAAEAAIRPPTDEERLVVAEMSRARLHPKEYAHWVRTEAGLFEGLLWHLPDHVPIRTAEGVPALDELLRILDHAPSTGPLRWSEGLGRAARSLVLEQGPAGGTGHLGPSGSTLQTRTLRQGLYQSQVGEVIHYGAETARWVVLQLLIDDGVPSRAHRRTILDPAFHVAGAATGPHSEYEGMTVVDLADAFLENP